MNGSSSERRRPVSSSAEALKADHAIDYPEALERIRGATRARTHLVSRHALDQMYDRDIDLSDIINALVLDRADVIETRPDDPRAPFVLLLCHTPRGPLHAGFGMANPIVLWTTYRPDHRFDESGRIRGRPE